MDSRYTNIYARCRHRLGLSAEQWAERLDLSVDSVKRYESGERIPSNATVVRMVNESGYEYLAMQHLVETSRSLDVLPDMDGETTLPQAAIRLINRVLAFADKHRDRQLLQIAEDGVVSEEERPVYNAILEELQEIISAAYQVRYADDGGGGRK